MKFDPQQFGRDCPPFYKAEECVEIIRRIANIDEKINDLFIERELYVKDLEQKIKKTSNSKNKD